MGRTYTNQREYDDRDAPRKIKAKPPKHSRNISGKGMRVINSMSDDDFDLQESNETNDKYDEYTSTT